MFAVTDDEEIDTLDNEERLAKKIILSPKCRKSGENRKTNWTRVKI